MMIGSGQSVQYGLDFNSIMERDGLNGVELRHLRALVAIAETCSFARAGERLGYAQSAVSQQIGALERAVGSRLVERPGGPRPVSLTEAGSVLVDHAKAILARLGAARDDLEALRLGDAGTVRVGTFQSAGAQLLPAILLAFRSTHPGVTVELSEMHSDTALLDQVAAGELDCTFAAEPVVSPELFEKEILIEDPYVVVAPPTSPLAGQTSATLADLAGQDLVSWQQCRCWEQLERSLRSSGVEPNVVFRTDDNLTLQRLAGAGLGHAVMTELCIERGPQSGPAIVLPLGDEVPPRLVGLFWRRARRPSPALQAFVETARTVSDRMTVAAAA
jgi:DNA-binding transcriptional LysR family regulator